MVGNSTITSVSNTVAVVPELGARFVFVCFCFHICCEDYIFPNWFDSF